MSANTQLSTTPLPFNRLVVVGASVGGVAALTALAAALPADFAAPLMVVLHTGSHPSLLPELLAERGRLPAAHAVDGERLEPGRIYVAPPDQHMLVQDGHVRLTRGPKEHHTRPSLDPLFLSAALRHGPAVIGAVLSGTLEDGTAGLQAIKACGGVAVVQDPDEAQAPGMPLSALRYVQVDHKLRLEGLAKMLTTLARIPPLPLPTVQPAGLIHEEKLADGEGDFVQHLQAIGRPAPFVCPDCKGGLWQLDGTAPIRYRCHTGHAFTLKTLQQAMTETLDQALWTAVRALQEQTVLLGMLSMIQRQEGEEQQALRLDMVRQSIEMQGRRLRELAEQASPSVTP
ncbi:MAG: chemotaxis protein CheB [Variovorax sp.]|nr:MAG: chemotaxis protein CheB [Variovorax sp.]